MDQKQEEKCLFERFGGDGQISDLIDQFYYKVLFDQTLRGVFLNSDMTRVRLQQKTYFAELFHCPHTKYQGRDIYDVHKDLGITDKQFDKFVHHLKFILSDMGKDNKLINDIMQKVEGQRHLVVIKKENQQSQ